MATAQLGRLRRSKILRDWVSQTNLSLKDIIVPYFVVSGKNLRQPIKAMPGIEHLSVDCLLKDLAKLKGIGAVLLFGLPESKDNSGRQSYKKNGIVQTAISAVKKEFPRLIVISDVCLCGYTMHGHCGILKRSPQSTVRSPQENYGLWTIDYGFIDNTETIKVLTKIAVSHAEAGVDLVAPSAMADGQVAAIRMALDKKGFKNIGILAYSAKYASNFYGPFREALDSAPQFGDRKSYQLDFRNLDGALREIEQDIREGADMVMVKPALAYLDIIYRAKQKFNLPLAAYNVSGEYSLIKKSGTEQKDLALEVLTAIKRAGADFIITYFAKDLIKWLST